MSSLTASIVVANAPPEQTAIAAISDTAAAVGSPSPLHRADNGLTTPEPTAIASNVDVDADDNDDGRQTDTITTRQKSKGDCHRTNHLRAMLTVGAFTLWFKGFGPSDVQTQGTP